MFKKSGFLRSGYPDGSGTIRGPSGGQGKSVEAKKAKIRIFEKMDFPDPDPDFRISAHRVATGGPKATCSQNFKALAAVVLKWTSSLTIIKYRIRA